MSRATSVGDGPRRTEARALGAGVTVADYQLLVPIANGGMGSVWAARHLATDRLVALKTILPSAANDAAVRAMFLDEARIAKHIGHPNECRRQEPPTADSTWRSNGSTATHCRTSGARPQIPPRVALLVVREICDALHAAHELIGDDGEPLILVHPDVSRRTSSSRPTAL